MFSRRPRGLQQHLPGLSPSKDHPDSRLPTLSASWRPSSTAFMNGLVAALRSVLARLRALSSSSRISGRIPFCLCAFTK